VVSIFVFTIIDQFFCCVMVWMIFYLVFLGTPENSNGGEYRAHYILFLVFLYLVRGFYFCLLIFRIFARILQKKTMFPLLCFFQIFARLLPIR